MCPSVSPFWWSHQHVFCIRTLTIYLLPAASASPSTIAWTDAGTSTCVPAFTLPWIYMDLLFIWQPKIMSLNINWVISVPKQTSKVFQGLRKNIARKNKSNKTILTVAYLVLCLLFSCFFSLWPHPSFSIDISIYCIYLRLLLQRIKVSSPFQPLHWLLPSPGYSWSLHGFPSLFT